MQKSFIFFLASLFCIGTAMAGGQVEGLVSADGLPLPGVAITTGDFGAYTDAEGRYSIELPAGKHLLNFSFIGYDAEQRSIELEEGQVLQLDVVMKEKALGLDVAVISASRYEQRLEEVTVSMEVLKPEIIQNKNLNDLSQLMQQTPGVAIVDEEPQIRASSGYSFGAGSRVQVMVDGLPILSGDAGRPTWRFLPMENVNQVEVIKGASSVLYGSAATGGVIHLRTAYPSDKPLTRITTFAGQYSDPQNEASIYWERNSLRMGVNALHSQKLGQLDLVVGANAFTDEAHLGPIDEEKSFNPSRVNRFSGEARVRGNVNLRYRHPKRKGLSFGLNTNWMKSEQLATLLWQHADTALYKASGGSATRTEQTIGNVDPFITYVGPKGSSHQLLTRWQSLDNLNDNNQSNFSDVYYANYIYGKRLSENLRITSGLSFTHTQGESELFAGSDRNGDNTAGNQAAYVQLDATLRKKLRLSGGFRYERFSINDERSAKPIFRAGANYTLAKATFLRASFGQGFRFPSIAEKFIQTNVGDLAIYPNEGIEAETSNSYEIGVKQGFKLGKVIGFLDVAAFHQSYQNFVEFTFGQWAAEPSFENNLGLGFRSLNTGDSRISGVELSVSGKADWDHAQLVFFGGYTYSNPRIDDAEAVYAVSTVEEGNTFALAGFEELNYLQTSSDTSGVLKYRLEHLLRSDVQFSYKKWTLGGSFRYNSTIKNIDKIFLDLDDPDFFPHIPSGLRKWREENQKGDGIVDARLLYAVNDHWRIGLLADNLLNREYAIRPLAIEPGRVFSFQLTFTR